MSQEELEKLVTACRELGENISEAEFDTLYAQCNVWCVRTLIEAVTALVEREQERME